MFAETMVIKNETTKQVSWSWRANDFSVKLWAIHLPTRAHSVQAVWKSQSNQTADANQGAWKLHTSAQSRDPVGYWRQWWPPRACGLSPVQTSETFRLIPNHRGKCAYIHWPQNPPWELTTVSAPCSTHTGKKNSNCHASSRAGQQWRRFHIGHRTKLTPQWANWIAQFQTSLWNNLLVRLREL
jgi:hypothetical protein